MLKSSEDDHAMGIFVDMQTLQPPSLSYGAAGGARLSCKAEDGEQSTVNTHAETWADVME